MTRLLAMIAALAALALAAPAQAHFLWLAPEAGAAPGRPLTVEVGWGHAFPRSEDCDTARLQGLRALGPRGRAALLEQDSPLQYRLHPEKPGYHLVLAAYEPGFLTKTTSGYRRQDKRGLAEALSCFRYDLRAKALVPAGGKEAGHGQSAGDVLEIVPLAPPGSLRPDQELPVQVLFQGEPRAGVQLQATHAGFSPEPNRFAWEGVSDGEGRARVRLAGPGLQMIAATLRLAHPEPEVCDQLLYKYTLTFRLP